MSKLKNIAIFYDIENLVGGYNFKNFKEVSLKQIYKEISKKQLGTIAIQKAYADWSNINYSKLKWDIVELGIDPIQMYGLFKRCS